MIGMTEYDMVSYNFGKILANFHVNLIQANNYTGKQLDLIMPDETMVAAAKLELSKGSYAALLNAYTGTGNIVTVNREPIAVPEFNPDGDYFTLCALSDIAFVFVYMYSIPTSSAESSESASSDERTHADPLLMNYRKGGTTTWLPLFSDEEVTYSEDGRYELHHWERTISVNSGELIQLYNTDTMLSTETAIFAIDQNFIERKPGPYFISGNMKSLINFAAITPHCFREMFASSVSMVGAEKLIDIQAYIPRREQLADYCFYRTFEGASIIKLPAGILQGIPATESYGYCFARCTKLNDYDVNSNDNGLLPACSFGTTITLGSNAYSGMLQSCRVTIAPLIRFGCPTIVQGNIPFFFMQDSMRLLYIDGYPASAQGTPFFPFSSMRANILVSTDIKLFGSDIGIWLHFFTSGSSVLPILLIYNETGGINDVYYDNRLLATVFPPKHITVKVHSVDCSSWDDQEPVCTGTAYIGRLIDTYTDLVPISTAIAYGSDLCTVSYGLPIGEPEEGEEQQYDEIVEFTVRIPLYQKQFTIVNGMCGIAEYVSDELEEPARQARLKEMAEHDIMTFLVEGIPGR